MGHTAGFLKDYHVLPRKKEQRAGLPLLRPHSWVYLQSLVLRGMQMAVSITDM